MVELFYKLAQVTYNEKTVCVSVGLELSFKCKYPLGDVTLSSDLAVSGHDDTFDAEGEGKVYFWEESQACLDFF